MEREKVQTSKPDIVHSDKQNEWLSSEIVQRGEKLLLVGMIKKGLTLQIHLRTDPKTTQIKASL